MRRRRRFGSEIVSARWRLERIWAMETALLNLEMVRQRKEVEKEYEAIYDDARLAIAFRSLADASKALELLHRYETRYSRAMHRAFETLGRLRAEQKLPNEPKPAPAEPVKTACERQPVRPREVAASPLEFMPGALPGIVQIDAGEEWRRDEDAAS